MPSNSKMKFIRKSNHTCNGQHSKGDTNTPKPTTEDFTSCASYLSENFNQPISLRKTAKIYGYSYDYFLHRFKKEIGMSPKNFIMSKRLNEAYHMITSSNESCTQIAYKCGFSDSAQLSKLFKKHFSISPKKLQIHTRKHNKN